MKSNRTFRHIISAIAATIGMNRPRSTSYPSPSFIDGPSKGGDTRARWRRRKPLKRLQPPAFVPGTITYFDWLVRELGYNRRLADGYMYAFQNGYKVKMPMPKGAI